MANITKRIDKDPEIELLIESLLNGSFGRQQELLDFIQLLQSTTGNFSIFLDGNWGSGKTFFVKEIEIILKAGHYHLRNPDITLSEEQESKLNQIAQNYLTEPQPICCPIYFNAWEYDYVNDPVIPLVMTIGNVIYERKSNLVSSESNFKTKLGNLLSKIGSLRVGYKYDDIEYFAEVGLNNAQTEKDPIKELFKQFNARSTIRTNLTEVLDKGNYERCDRFVLFVDELDRCRPEYAVKVLEALKFLFIQNNLTIVFSTNMDALSKSISSWYGNGFDGYKYLMKFYDQIFSINEFDICSYLWIELNIDVQERSYLWNHIRNMSVTMRDLNRIGKCLKKYTSSYIYSSTQNTSTDDIDITIYRYILISVLIFGSLHSDQMKEKFFNGVIPEEYFAYAKNDVILIRKISNTKDIDRYEKLVSNSEYQKYVNTSSPKERSLYALLDMIFNYDKYRNQIESIFSNNIVSRSRIMHAREELLKVWE